jgi:DNA-directed RNA polymerase
MNKTAFTVLDLDLEEPNKDLEEKHSIWEVRKATMPHMIGKPIYFNWHPDYRGRVYDAGYHYHIQSEEFSKNMIAFNESEYITPEGIDSIKCAIASAFGQDKEIDEVKLKWYAENADTLDYKTAKEPHTAMVQMMSLQSAIEDGYTNIPREIDASCSQRQVVAVLTKCKTTASACNIYNPENNEIQDAYKLVANEMSRLLQEIVGE